MIRRRRHAPTQLITSDGAYSNEIVDKKKMWYTAHRLADHNLNPKLVRCARNKLKLCVSGSGDNQPRWFTAKYVNCIDDYGWMCGRRMYELLRRCVRQKCVISWSRKTILIQIENWNSPKTAHQLTSEPCFIFNWYSSPQRKLGKPTSNSYVKSHADFENEIQCFPMYRFWDFRANIFGWFCMNVTSL